MVAPGALSMGPPPESPGRCHHNRRLHHGRRRQETGALLSNRDTRRRAEARARRLHCVSRVGWVAGAHRSVHCPRHAPRCGNWAVLALIIWKAQSRVGAVLLTGAEAVITVLNRIGAMSSGGSNVFLAIIMLILSIRLVEATFKLARAQP